MMPTLQTHTNLLNSTQHDGRLGYKPVATSLQV